MTMRRPIIHFFLSCVLSFAAATAAVAQGASINLGVRDHNAGTPVEITSEELSIDQDKKVAEFDGNVIVRQGDITMTCSRMTVEYGPDANGDDEIKTIRMFGGVTFASSAETAESNEAVYSLISEVIVMTGDVLVTQGPTALASNKLTYNLETGSGVMEGNVKTILQSSN